MALCAGLAPPPKGRKVAHQQRCAAAPEEGTVYCRVHAKAAGFRRCGACGYWTKPVPWSLANVWGNWQCQNGCSEVYEDTVKH